MNITTPEQSKKLAEKGLPIETADVIWKKAGNDLLPKFISDPEIEKQAIDDIPAWSFSHLLEDIIPPTISGGSSTCNLSIDMIDKKLFYIDQLRGTKYGPVNQENESISEAIIGMVEWLLERALLTCVAEEKYVYVLSSSLEEDVIEDIIYSDRGKAESVRAILTKRDGKEYRILTKRLR